MEDDDPIKKLLQQTGWSYIEVLKKLEAYKDQFPSDPKFKGNGSENSNTCDIILSTNQNKNIDIPDDKKEDVVLGNDINDVELETFEEESTNSDKKENTEPKTNEIYDAESRSDKENCVTMDGTKEKSNKNQELRTDEQECKNSSDLKKEDVDLKVYVANNSEPKNEKTDKLGNSTDNPASAESRDEELENIIQRLEKFIEENAESDNEESYAEMYAKKSEYENNEKQKNSESEKKLGGIIKTSEQNTNFQDNKKEILENVAGRKSESECSNQEKLEEVVEETSKSIEKNKDAIKISREVMKANRESDRKKLENGSEKCVESKEIAITEKSKLSKLQMEKLEKARENNSITEETNSIIEKCKDIEQSTESEISEGAIQCNSESEPNDETLKKPAQQNTESENDEKGKSVKTAECNVETRLEEKLKNVAEKNLESKQNDIKENSKSIIEQIIEMENAVQHKSDNHDTAKSKEDVENVSGSEEISIVVESKKIIEPNTNSEETLDSNAIKHNLESEAKEKEKSEQVAENRSDSEEEDKLENFIERLEKIIEGRAEFEDNKEANLDNTDLQSKELSEESANPNDVTQNLEKSTQESHIEPLNPDDQKGKSLNISEPINQTIQDMPEELEVEIHVNSPNSSYYQCKKTTSRNLKRNLSNIRLRIIRKCKNTLNRKIKKRSDNNPKVIQTEDIRSKIREQLELLRTKRKTVESPLISSPPKSSCSLKFSQRNVNRLNNITSTLIQKLCNGNNKVLPKIIDGDLQVENIVNEECDFPDKKPVNKLSEKSHKPEESVVLSNETDLMIVNVVGGYKSPTPEERFDVYRCEVNGHEGKGDHNKEFLLNGITPTKTTDVTKIKGWKNKKFAIANQQGQSKPSDKLLFQLMHDNSVPNQPNDSTPDDQTIIQQSPPILTLSEKPEETNQSAFISDELDQYLTENAELKISYEVPKLEAEQTITTKYIDIKFPQFQQQNPQSSHAKNKDFYKPKTLAEKRKMLAESDKPEIRDFFLGMNTKQRRSYEESVLSMRKKLIEEDIPFTRRCFMTSTSITNTHNFVVYNGRRLKVPSRSNKEVIVQIRERRKVYKNLPTPARPKLPRQRKLSLLSELKTSNKFGHDLAAWETVQLKLPKLTLEIKPQIGKRIHPRIEHLIKSDGLILTENRVEFALSALRVKNSTIKSQVFSFPLSYNNNHEYITARRRAAVVIDISMDVEKPVETDAEIAKSVADVVDKMLDYIEISEETKDIIQDETSPDNGVEADLPKQTDNFPDKNWRRRKRRVIHGEKGVHRTTLEMKRLNCKIVSISLDEENAENESCTKEFCKLGCICKSIECNSTNLLASHCGLSRCMFNCKCRCKNMGVGENFSLPAGTDIFSEGMINRLQDEAKKNLAKVEKEFTQTVIRTNNQIIVVGDSKERRRRATKMPKKYIDFVEEDPSDKPVSKYVATESKYRSLTERLTPEQPATEPFNNDTIMKTDEVKDIKNCFVKLFTYDFSEIMPFCLVHSLYKCHCKNKAIFDSSVGDKNIVACTYVNPPTSVSPSETPVRNRLKSRIDKTFNKELYSSRTRGLVTSYYFIRNKSLSHKCKLKKSSRKLQRELEIYLRQNASKIMQDAKDPPVEHAKLLDRPDSPKEPKRQRKQSLIVLEDPGSDSSRIRSPAHVDVQQHGGNEAERELKLQRRRTKTKLTKQEQSKTIAASPATVLFSDTNKLKSEFISLLGKKTSQLRLLPWTTLAERFENGSFQVWYSSTSKISPLIITENGKRPTHRHANVRLSEYITHETSMPAIIISWLITKKVPLEKSVENILLVLSHKKFYWEICGICERNKPDPKTKENVSISLIHSWNNSETTDTDSPSADVDDADTNKNSAETEQNILGETEAMVHENLQENKKVMYCSKRRFQPKKLVSDEIDDDSLKIRQVLWAPIPSVSVACKWRVIYMNLGFAYLSLSRSSYTIKYEDIMKAMKIANKDKITIVLKSEELQKNYPHRNFGIYCVHNYTDKVFVGPYFLNENHDLDTLSFVNGVLVNTSLLNQIKGKGVSGGGRWFHQATNSNDKNGDDDVVIIQEPAPVVDLTCESDEESSNNSKKGKTNLENPPSKNHSTLLKSMLLTKTYPDSEEEVAKAERALDTLLKKGQINVNKTLVHLDSLKTSDTENNPLQPAPTVYNAPPKTTANQITEDISDSNDEDRLVIDEENQQSEFEATDRNNVNPNKVNRYLVTNIPRLGYISAYQHETTNIVDVVCPITKKMKQFSAPEAAIAALERVFTNKFIRVPTGFKLEFKMLEKLENTTDLPLDRSILHGYHIVGAFGVRNLLHCTATELETFGLNKVEITHIWNLFEKKLLLAPLCQLGKLLAIPVRENAMEFSLSQILARSKIEIKILQKDSALFIKKKIELESKKVMLAEKCSKLHYQLPPNQRNIAQQELDRIINFSNREISLNNTVTTNNSKSKISGASEPIILDDDEDDTSYKSKDTFLTSSTSRTIPLIVRKKFPVYSGTSLLTGRKIEASSQIIQGTLFPKPFKAPSNVKDNKYVVVQRKRNATGSLVSTANTVDLSRCTFQIKPSQSHTEEKMLVKEVPIKVRKDMLEAANNSVLQLQQQQKKPLFLCNGGLANVIRTIPAGSMSKNIFNNVSTISKVPKINNKVIPTTCSNASKYTISNVAQPKTANVVSSTGLPVACVPVTVVPTASKTVGSSIKTSTMATLTPMQNPPDFVLTNSTAKSTPNYITIKEGDNLKCFQLVSETKAATTVLQPVQAIKRPASSIRIQPPLKRIAPAPATSLLTNQKTDT